MLQRLVILAVVTCSFADPRSPRIYNVLITSKKNLAPSQAVPVYEPVLRTTSLGYAFSPFVYTHVAPLPHPNIYAPQTEAVPNFIRQQVDGQGPVRSPENGPADRYPQNGIVEPKYIQRTIHEAVPESNPGRNSENRYAEQEPGTSRSYQDLPQSEVQPVTYAKVPEDPRRYQSPPPSRDDQEQSNPYAEQDSGTSRNYQTEVQPVTYAKISEDPRRYKSPPPSRDNQAQSNLYPQTAANVRTLPSNVVPLQQYVPYYTPLAFPQYFPSEEILRMQPQRSVAYDKPREENDPKQIVANFRRNPGIPDVPPPPIPVKTS